MTIKTQAQDFAEELGLQIYSTARHGLHAWIDVGRIKPMRSFSTIFDIGAHHGETAIALARRAPRARIYSFEPASSNFRQLAAQVRSLPNVTCVQSAVGDTPGELELFLNSSRSQMNSFVSRAPGATAESVKVTTVDDFAEQQEIRHVDLLKTDTEGFDINVLRGARRMIEQGRIDFVFSEATFDASLKQCTHFPPLLAEATDMGLRLLGLYDISVTRAPWGILWCNALFTRL